MIAQEPVIQVGILDQRREVRGRCNAIFALPNNLAVSGEFQARAEHGGIVLKNGEGAEIFRAREIHLRNFAGSTFTLHDVVIGIDFHWERKEEQTFQGDLRLLLRHEGTLLAINEIALEDYLASVISSEMSATAPSALLQAHAITSRSWLMAMLARAQSEKLRAQPAQRTLRTPGELIRWYDREDHDRFQVCADDHCQRYQGVTKIISPAAADAVLATRGVFLVYENEICDARFSKACGGLTEEFENCWEEQHVPYLQCLADATIPHPPVHTEHEAARWILSRPEAFCRTASAEVIRQILPSFDQETTDFYRWTVTYDREELEEILLKKSGINFGQLHDLEAVARGPSGRIIKLRIVGSQQTLVVGKELEIRRWLSRSHLYSSAFVIQAARQARGVAKQFVLHGAGWGHGVGLCQIGAAIMATKGYKSEEIVRHYFRGAQLKTLY